MVYAGHRSQSLNQDIATLLKEDCQNRNKCLEHYKNTIEENTRVIKQSGTKEALADLDDKIAENELMVEKTKGQQCGNCFSNFDKKLKREKRAYHEIVLVEGSNKTKNPEVIDTQFLVDSLFEPLANHSRLKILFSVSEGKRSFSELSRTVDLKAGHLAFHLKKLVDANLMAQEASKGDYVITQRGLKLIKTVGALSTEAHSLPNANRRRKKTRQSIGDLMKIKIRMFSDYICPFCYLGKAIIDKLKNQFDIELEHVGIEIHPETPICGVDLRKYISQTNEMYEHLRNRGREYGLNFCDVMVMPNSRRSSYSG